RRSPPGDRLARPDRPGPHLRCDRLAPRAGVRPRRGRGDSERDGAGEGEGRVRRQRQPRRRAGRQTTALLAAAALLAVATGALFGLSVHWSLRGRGGAGLAAWVMAWACGVAVVWCGMWHDRVVRGE